MIFEDMPCRLEDLEEVPLVFADGGGGGLQYSSSGSYFLRGGHLSARSGTEQG